MKRFFALLICTLLCTQSLAYAAPAGPLLYEEDTGQGQNSDTVPDSADTKDAKTDNADASSGLNVSAPSAILMEASTGQVIFEKAADEQRPPASVTKVMTLLLIFDALKDGKIKLDDSVSVSEFAASMGGSQARHRPWTQ